MKDYLLNNFTPEELKRVEESKEKEIQLHFNECWDDTIYLTEYEADEWYYELLEILENRSVPRYVRLQRIIDNITN